MPDIDKYISLIYSEVKELEKRDPNCTIAYRGEPKDYKDTKLMPSIFRNPSYVKKEEKLFQLLKDYGVTDENAPITNVLIESQHFVEISRVLDITFSAISALFFACSSDTNANEAGIVYVFGFPEYVSPHSSFIERYFTKNGQTISYHHNFKIVSHAQENERIISQKGGFIFFQGDDFIPLNSIYYREIKIEAEDKENILKRLDTLFGVNEATIYPDRGRVAKKIVKPKFEAISDNEDELSIQNEICNAFERLKYEAKMEKYEGRYDRTVFLRRLRKEKNDLLVYVDAQDCQDKNEYVQLIKSKYCSLGGR